MVELSRAMNMYMDLPLLQPHAGKTQVLQTNGQIPLNITQVLIYGLSNFSVNCQSK